MNGQQITDRIRAYVRAKGGYAIADDTPIGVVAPVRAKAEVPVNEPREIVVIANTAEVDCDDEVVVPSGGNAAYFQQNKTIFRDHYYGITDAVGTLRFLNLMRSPGGDYWKARFRVSDANRPLTDDVLTLAAEGCLGVSIGFVAKVYGRPTEDELKRYGNGKAFRSIVREWDWMELSVTCMPCNVSCRTLSVSGAENAKQATLDELVTKGRIRRESAVLLGMVDRKVFVPRYKATAVV